MVSMNEPDLDVGRSAGSCDGVVSQCLRWAAGRDGGAGNTEELSVIIATLHTVGQLLQPWSPHVLVGPIALHVSFILLNVLLHRFLTLDDGHGFFSPLIIATDVGHWHSQPTDATTINFAVPP